MAQPVQTLDAIIAGIKTIIESVDGIGKVYDTILYATSEEEMQRYFAHDNRINVCMFREYSTSEQEDEEWRTRGNVTVIWERKWRFLLFYSYSKEQDSGLKVRNIKEALMRAFNDNPKLNETVQEHTKLQATQALEFPYHNILCHSLEFELTTFNR